jgi:hypothetical protein
MLSNKIFLQTELQRIVSYIFFIVWKEWTEGKHKQKRDPRELNTNTRSTIEKNKIGWLQ